ncbi:unnamed protein product, partial [Haemonchus placei]|uniref:Tyrosine-protein phosphatase domain-containing protein n=1 Tax=Haemonchus placei TaxID=6290 RepID=A0A158QR38_HAEPC
SLSSASAFLKDTFGKGKDKAAEIKDETEKKAESAADSMKDMFKNAQDSANKAWDDTGKGVSSAYDSAKNKVSTFASDAQAEAKKAGETTADTAHDVGEKLKHTAHDVASAGDAKLHSAEDSAAKALEHAKQKVGELTDKASQKATELSAHAREEAKAAEASVKDAASAAAHKAHELGKFADDTTSSAIAEAKSELAEACDAIQERATAIVEEVKHITETSPQSPDKVPGQAASAKVAGQVDEVTGAEAPEKDFIANVYHEDVVEHAMDEQKKGPLLEYVGDFWHMITSESSKVIVMLCNFNEGKHEKCCLYLPKEKKEVGNFGGFAVAVKASKPDPFENIKHTELEVKYGEGKTFTVHHLAYFEWPDHTAPLNPGPTVGMLKLSRTLAAKHPITVHCSAGIGRSATFVGKFAQFSLFWDYRTSTRN